ncbi:GAF domain-containing protein [Herbaspirillum sp. YR522]|uniref:helix-turn-helix domain-containing protein n=1 Tax=Herbaspirillum sp. YR522 TaxID=1144342 RepID=UPI00026FAB7E|nr:GAF domain-containing protein [Herbaspirillum sp. YR522]EJM95983.1 sugar diacid utilization regulator [Herbaspirillum sp. YR522]
MNRLSPAPLPTVPSHEDLLALLDQDEEQHAALTALLRDIEQLPDDHPQRHSLLGAAHRALSIGKRLERHRQNELSLRGVFESAQALTELKELGQVLFDIVERGRRLLGSDLAWLAGMNDDHNNLGVLAVSGVYSNETKNTNTPLNTGVAGHVMRTRSPFATSDYMGDRHFEHTAENDQMIRREGLRSLVAAPLLSGAEVVGILIVGDRYARSYAPREISILATLAAHASVAVRNARAFDLTRQALLETEQANRRLQEQTAALELAADAHEQLTRLLARGAPLKDLIHTVANILDGRVLYLDAAGIEVCVATPRDYEAPEVIDSYRSFSGIDSAIQSAISQSRASGRATAAGAHCQVAAVMSRDELFGALVIQTRLPMNEPAVRIFERSATATAVLQLSAEKSSASLDQDINLTMRALLEPRQHDGELAGRLARHGVDLAKPCMLAMIQIERTRVGYAVRKLSSRLRHLPHLATDIDGRIVMAVNQADRRQLEQELHAALFEELSFPGIAVLSGPYDDLAGLAGADQHLKRALGLLQALRRRNCVAHEASLRMYAVLFQHQDAATLDAAIDGVIGRLTEQDARRNTQLTDTLHTYLDHMQNARATATVLQIHVNTLHNRLEVISTLLGPWESDGRVADIHVALRLKRLRDELPGGGGKA